MNAPIFCVLNEPYCLWDPDYKQRNIEFLNGIDIDYYDFLVETFLECDDDKRSSVALKQTLHHSIETMFILIGAYIQGPDVAYAWVTKCQNNDLRKLLTSINQGSSDFYIRNPSIENLSMFEISKSIFQYSNFSKIKSDNTIKLFSSLWRRLSNEFLDPNNIDEYNSLKHGFRIQPGGTRIRFGVEKTRGVSPPESEFKTLGNTQYGSTFFKVETIPETRKNRSIRTRRISNNWSFERVALMLQLVNISIKNIVQSLLILNGTDPNKTKFFRPENESDFSKPWNFSPGLISSNFDMHIPVNQVKKTSRDELLEIIKKKE